MRIAQLALACLAAAATGKAQDAALAHSREVVQKVCGVCHTPESVLTNRRTRAQWQETIERMVTAQGAKGTPEEFATVLDYLTSQYSPDSPAPTAIGRGGGRARGGEGRGGGRPSGMGPDDKHIVDEAAADRGRKVWAAECINCHGPWARGTDDGPNLIRSEMVLHDRYADHIGPFLRKGHTMQSGARSDTLTDAQISDLAHFIHQRVYDTLRGSPIFVAHDLLTGNAAAGKAYFNGEGRCHTCHSPTGDLAGVARKYTPINLQARFLYPAGKRPAAIVTTASGQKVSGTVLRMDDFSVAVRDSAGWYHSWPRAAVKVEAHDPLAAHRKLLYQYTDRDMHNLFAYLETLK